MRLTVRAHAGPCAPSVDAAGEAADSLKDFYAGIRLTLSQMLVSPNFLWAARHTKKRRYGEANGGQHHNVPGDYMVFFFPQASMQANLVHRFTYCGMPHNCPFLYATHRSGERWGVDVPLVIPSANGLPGVVGYASFRM